MNKSELINAIAERVELKLKDAEKTLQAVLEIVMEKLAAGDDVTLIGFGTFTTVKRAARTGRNPITGKELHIAGSTIPKFKPGKKFKEAVAGEKK